MTTDLDRYGLVALAIIIVLIIIIGANDLTDDSDPTSKMVIFDDSADPLERSGEPAEPEARIVLLDEDEPTPSLEGFDFMEEPVEYPGSPATPVAVNRGTPASLSRHKVKKGETLSSISRKYLGSSQAWRQIVAANPSVNPNRLMVGTELVIPGSPGNQGARRAAPVAATPNRPPPSRDRYKVKNGDTLSKISKIFYGNEGYWKRIYTANKDKLSSPKKLIVGSTLVIPRQ
jgi:nucleoid-associated protein YgaU